MLLQPGNTKLGPRIKNFALPAVETCFPSEACLKVCFGTKFRYKMEYVKKLYERNWDLTYADDFKSIVSAELKYPPVPVCRWHTVGDYFRAEPPLPPDAYVRLVTDIVRDNLQTHFYGYTRSWTQPDLRPALLRLSRQPNFTLWLSCDHSMPRPPKWKQSPLAYMAMSDDDAPNYKVDLVFRAGSRLEPRKRDIRGNLICPYEQGIQRQVAITCTTCGICFEQKPVYQISRTAVGVA